MKRVRNPFKSAIAAACFLMALPCADSLIENNIAHAQSVPEVSARLSSPEVEVGEPFSVELKAMSEGGSSVATDPELRSPAGFSVSGPMISTQSFMQFGTGGRRVQQGIGATWNLVASAPGSFTIPAPSVLWNGQRIKAQPLSVVVVPQGTKPKKQGGFLMPGGGGWNPFGSNWPFGSGSDDLEDYAEEPSLSLPRAPNNDVFLHATVDKKKVVVGEQVTISIWRYRGTNSIADISDSHPMPLQDFLRQSLTGDNAAGMTQIARAGARKFVVRLLEKTAAFPLRTGMLKTGTYTETYVPISRRGKIHRASPELTIEVVEPPLANRPPGYRLGDVGRFQITSLVQPRKVEEGGNVAVTVKVTGAGNFPTSLRMPEKTGIEWLDPEKKETIEVQSDELVGFRSFGYVVKLTKSGTVDLGTIELPHWNPRAKRYEVARSQLGTIEVTPSKAAPVSPAPSGSAAPVTDDALFNLAPPRTALAPFSVPQAAALLPGFRFPLAVTAPPIFAVIALAGIEMVRRAKTKIADKKSSPGTLAMEALKNAKDAKKAGDERAAAALVERALNLAIEAATGIKARGILKDDLFAELTNAGISNDHAKAVSQLLAACDLARFDPLAAADVSIADGES
ncbi:MAG: BatD family protein [Polyangiaceae bacterium]|nr:BatD family protein [Polyangiaceae bacterium]